MRMARALRRRASAPGLAGVTLADFIVRSAYQVGKTPLLPIFAASLGASDALLGLIVSVSTLTGMVTKPLFGLLSDRTGRRLWLLIGTAVFAGAPFLYGLVETPAHLIAVRLIHGAATAIYGPVTVAYVAERGGRRRAERLGWFGMARSGGYLVGPFAAGWLLLRLEPATVFTLIGVVSMAAFAPVLALRDDEKGKADADPSTHAPLRRGRRGRPPTAQELRTFFRRHAAPLGTAAVWLSGALEAAVFVATYAIKAFLPLYALTAGYSTVEIGLFFSLQEGTLMLLKPWGGRVGDRLGRLRAVALGMVGLAASLPLLLYVSQAAGLLAVAAALGGSQALVFPATVALIAEQAPAGRVGAGIGLAGSLKNAGKVAGPVVGGLLIAAMGYAGMFWLLAALLSGGALALCLRLHPPASWSEALPGRRPSDSLPFGGGVAYDKLSPGGNQE